MVVLVGLLKKKEKMSFIFIRKILIFGVNLFVLEDDDK